MDLNALAEARRILYHDPDFIEQDARGRRMYSSGLNNYYRFASGEGFTEINSEGTNDHMKLMDIPISPESPRTVSRIE